MDESEGDLEVVNLIGMIDESGAEGVRSEAHHLVFKGPLPVIEYGRKDNRLFPGER